jgi:integrase
MPKLSLTDRAVVTAKAGDLFDTLTPGLNLRVAASGVRTWFLVYSSPSGKRARVKLGRYPQLSLAEARARAVELKQQLHEGRDPRGRAPGAMTVADLVLDYINKHAAEIKTGKALEARLRRDVLRAIGAVELHHLHRRDVHRVIDTIKERGSPGMAKKVFDDLGAMLRWAVGRGYLDVDPTAQMDGPRPSEPRDRFLSEAEISALWCALPPTIAEPLKLSLITGQRIGEVCGMTSDELDWPRALWTIPASRTKNGYEHTVPLSPMALDLIGPRFEGRRFKVSAASVTREHLRRRADLPVTDWTAHDLRRTAATHMEELGISPLVIGYVLNHRSVTKATITSRIYARYDYASEKRDALELWANRLSAIIAGSTATVVPITRKA